MNPPGAEQGVFADEAQFIEDCEPGVVAIDENAVERSG
jgi:hypothetical protein